jgi:hypothetical protein
MDNQKRFIKCIMGNLVHGNTKISIDRLINIYSNNKLYFKSLLSNDEIVELDNIIQNIKNLYNYHSKHNQKLTLYYYDIRDCYILNYKDDKRDFNIFDNQKNLLNIINYLSNDNFQEIIKH